MENRRPIQARDTSWARHFARALAQAGFTPNSISILSVVFAAMAGTSLVLSRSHGAGWMLLAAVFVQARLLCNLFDGMVAVEHGKKTPAGEVFNDAPDRPADVFILVGAGYAILHCAWGSDLGWVAALLAVLTAYVRVLGGAVGAPQLFLGPMAKQHRMAVVTLACLVGFVERMYFSTELAIPVALAVIALGSLLTCGRRLRRIVVFLNRKA